MGENTIPEEIIEKTSDVAQETISEEEKVEDLSGKTLAELSEIFVKLKESAESMTRNKEADAIKSAFYKLLTKLKTESGVSSEEGAENPFTAVEENFKAIFSDYKKERAEFNRKQEEQREANLQEKKKVIEELKALVEGQVDVGAQFPAFRDLQARWRNAGPVPATEYREINESYQHLVEMFYDMVKIDRDLRDLDFKKNLDAKQAFCEAAEKLAENENVVEAFNELQKLHERWKEYGPVAKEIREDIWNRFKVATAVINKRYQAYFEDLKQTYEANLAKKTELCERLEALVAGEPGSSAEWNEISGKIEELQKEWKEAGTVARKDSQKIYDRFRKSCDEFYNRKREFYTSIKDNLNENLEKKMELIKEAEELKSSTEWKEAADKFKELQQQWKETGAVPRKKSEALWKRFRAACDEFFENRDKNSVPAENDFRANLAAKKRLIAEIEAFQTGDDETANADAMREFRERWNAIGHVPFKEKDKIIDAFKAAMDNKFPLFAEKKRSGKATNKSPRELMIEKHRSLQQDIATWENNIGFFSASKNANALVAQMQTRIDEAKAELKALEEKIRNTEEA